MAPLPNFSNSNIYTKAILLSRATDKGLLPRNGPPPTAPYLMSLLSLDHVQVRPHGHPGRQQLVEIVSALWSATKDFSGLKADELRITPPAGGWGQTTKSDTIERILDHYKAEDLAGGTFEIPAGGILLTGTGWRPNRQGRAGRARSGPPASNTGAPRQPSAPVGRGARPSGQSNGPPPPYEDTRLNRPVTDNTLDMNGMPRDRAAINPVQRMSAAAAGAVSLPMGRFRGGTDTGSIGPSKRV
jgi:hypothetical protein